MLELSRAILRALLLTIELIGNYIDGMGAKFEMLQIDKNFAQHLKINSVDYLGQWRTKVDAISVPIYLKTNI